VWSLVRTHLIGGIAGFAALLFAWASIVGAPPSEAASRSSRGYRILALGIYASHWEGGSCCEVFVYVKLNKKGPPVAGHGQQVGVLVDGHGRFGYEHPRNHLKSSWGAYRFGARTRPPVQCYLDGIFGAELPPVRPARQGRRYKITVLVGSSTLTGYARLVGVTDEQVADKDAARALGC
jgi:hypothetical protein